MKQKIKNNKKSILIFLGSIIGLIVAFILTNPGSIGLCPANNKYCFDPQDETIGRPLKVFSSYFLIISIILFFVKERVFYAWSKFAAIFILIAIIIIAKTPVYSANMIDPANKGLATLFLSLLFFIMSLSLILSKSLRPNWKLWIVLPISFVVGVVGIIAGMMLF